MSSRDRHLFPPSQDGIMNARHHAFSCPSLYIIFFCMGAGLELRSFFCMASILTTELSP